jgi:hypothetical protein
VEDLDAKHAVEQLDRLPGNHGVVTRSVAFVVRVQVRSCEWRMSSMCTVLQNGVNH